MLRGVVIACVGSLLLASATLARAQAPANPAPANPGPTKPAPAIPAPANPAPTKPSPTIPAPANPAPAPEPATSNPVPAPASPVPSPADSAPGPDAAADAGDLAIPVDEPRPVVGFRMRGKTKTSERTARYLARVQIGELVGPGDLGRIEQAFVSSELFESVAISLENAPGGVLVVATVKDKHSWVVAPTVYWQPGKRAFGVGFVENNLFGHNQKLLAYGQLGDLESLFFGTYLDPSVRGTPMTYRFDIYTYRRIVNEYANPTDDPTNTDISRKTTSTYLGGGALVGWRFAWWMIADLRFRGAYVYFRNPRADDEAETPLPAPQTDGWDFSLQGRLTLDARHHKFGVRWGPYLQLMADQSIPGLDDYGYSVFLARAFYGWKFFEEHQFETRVVGHVGRNLPFHEEITLGGITDLRGYVLDRFRGDVRTLFRAEYSFPLVRWSYFKFRGIGFFDTGYSGLHNPRTSPDRNYLPNQHDGLGWWRSDVGVGIRLYVKAIVLPLLGIDFAYAIDGKATGITFQLGLTDF